MKALNTRYLVLLLMLSMGSASAHALFDHDCSDCILSHSNKNLLLEESNDSNDGDNDSALIHSESNVFIAINKDSIVSENQELCPLSTQRHYSIRAPPAPLF